MKRTIKRDDKVVVITGPYKGKRSKVLQVFPSQHRIVVEGVALVKRHTKKNQQNPEGGIIEREASIHVSNVMQAERYDARQAKRNKGTTTKPKASVKNA